MIRYAPPKGQLWGHRRGRVAAATLCRRVREFLGEHAAGEPVWRGKLSVIWEGAADGVVLPAVEALRAATGLPLVITERARPSGWIDKAIGTEQARPNGWIDKAVGGEFSGPELDRVAAWVDGPGDVGRANGVCVLASANTVFHWKVAGGESPEPLEERDAGGVLGLQLSQPRGLTTIFSFRDVEHYQTVKRYLADHDVVTLQDKHVRPKGVLGE